jgi:hypothetical protein
MSAARGAAALLATIGLAACATFDPPSQPPAPASAAPTAAKSSAEELIAYLARIRTLGESALAAEAARQKREANDLARVKAALALSLTVQSEESDILALVDAPARKENIDADVRAMASFLQTLATERRRLKESAAAAGVRLRDERRAYEAQKQRAETLQQKLDALTELEKSLTDRQVPSR